MEFVFEPPPPASVAVRDQQARFPVRRIYCVGSNYADHAREMGRDPQREPPFFFSKPADAVIDDGAEIPYPAATKNFHFEGELVVAIGLAGHRIRQDQALDHVWGYAAGNDLTRRDLQQLAKDTARPWDMSKGFDQSAAIGPIAPVSEIGHVTGGAIRTQVNAIPRQQSDLDQMIWPVPDIIVFLSNLVSLAPGDLIMTGTPDGVGPLEPGDVVSVAIDGIGSVTTKIAPMR
ncbi:fumarylacetoacetate hydrolase family protein [Aliiroseovarius sp. PTFE2010]|uniref:fumarylacetoacetate hydrolase family protein n=1 Tax=Aliiroseovarius sp. PTFE2010 TaxID=3417190 RepID=UPI003CE7BAE2